MNNPHPSHFRLLRLAILRRLTVEQTGPHVFLVGSHSHPSHAHVVNPVEQSCCCPAFDWCCHLSIALDRWMSREASVEMRSDYFAARRLDFGGLHRRDDLARDDRKFLRVAVESVRAKHPHLFVTKEREQVSF